MAEQKSKGSGFFGFLGGIFSTIGNITGAVITAVDRKSQRQHEKDIMTYEATKYKTFYQFESSNAHLYVFLFIGLMILLLLWRISILKSTANNN